MISNVLTDLTDHFVPKNENEYNMLNYTLVSLTMVSEIEEKSHPGSSFSFFKTEQKRLVSTCAHCDRTFQTQLPRYWSKEK